jgi:hypothetical protein
VALVKMAVAADEGMSSEVVAERLRAFAAALDRFEPLG